MKRILILSTIVGLFSATAASAATINFQAGAHPLDGDGYTFSATGGSVVNGNKNGVQHVGVSGGWAGSEIDFGQELLLSFDQAMYVSSIHLGLLFNGPEYNDYQEMALLQTNNGTRYSLQVVSENLATWSMWNDGSWEAIGNVSGEGTVLGGPGLFVLNNPFQGAMVTSIAFSTGGVNEDYGVTGFVARDDAHHVPDTAATAVLLALGLGLAGAARARRIRA